MKKINKKDQPANSLTQRGYTKVAPSVVMFILQHEVRTKPLSNIKPN